MEHHSNIVPWQLLAERTGAQLVFLPINGEFSPHGDAAITDIFCFNPRRTAIRTRSQMFCS